MVDVRLITLIPSAPAVTQTAAPQAVSPQGAPVMPQLPVGSVLAGFIVNRDAKGNPILRTDQGDIAFSSNFFLKIGSDVVIRIQQSGGQQNAHIVTVNGLPPEVAAQQSSFGSEPEILMGEQQPATTQRNAAPPPQQAPAQVSESALPIPKAGQTISAIVIAPNTTPAAPPPAPPGTSFLLSVLGLNQPPPQQQTASPLAQLTAAPAKPTSNALSNLLPAAPAAITTQGTPVAPQPPALPPAITAPPAQSTASVMSNQEAAAAQLPGPLGQTLVATVVSVNEDDGSVTLDTPLGILRAANIGGPPSGQQVNLRVTSVSVPTSYTLTVANNAPALPPAPLSELVRHWASLGQIVQVLGEEQASRIIPNFPTTPNLTPDVPARVSQAASQILFFIAALKGGDLRGWLGADNVKTLEDKGYGTLLGKASGEFSLLARQFADVQPGNWQSTFFPVMAGGELHQLRAFVKREKKKNEQGYYTGEEDTRFVVEMELSQLGEMQMDGLVKRREKSMQFDLIIRSHAPLAKHVEQDIQAIYASTAEATGYHGQLNFQAVHAFPLNPIEDILPPTDDVIA